MLEGLDRGHWGLGRGKSWLEGVELVARCVPVGLIRFSGLEPGFVRGVKWGKHMLNFGDENYFTKCWLSMLELLLCAIFISVKQTMI